MKTTTNLFAIVLILLSINAFGQTSVQNGDWEAGSTWTGGLPLPLTDIGAAGSITVSDTVIAGSFGNNVPDPMEFSKKGAGNSLTIETGAVLIVYGNVFFEHQAMDLILNGTLIIIGDLTLEKDISINSTGNLVVTGTFTKTGSGNQGEYTGGGNVYAGAYDDQSTGGGGWVGDELPAEDQRNTSDLGTDGLDDIADFIDSGGADPLPITLGAFHLKPTAHSVEINWTTLSEENFDFFEIQRAGEDMYFETIGTVSGNGDSKVAIDYSWADENPNLGINYYRLISNDFDGYREIFKAEYVLFESNADVLSIYPNPAFPYDEISIQGSFQSDVHVTIYDLNGKEHKSFITTSNSFELQGELQKGLYLVNLSSNGLQKTQRLIVR